MPKSPTKKRPAKTATTARTTKRSTPTADAMTPRVARRERRRERSREEIVEAARRVWMRSGIAATTLAAVAREVGLTKAALYYYYPSKDALLFEVMFTTVEENAHAIHDAVELAKTGGEALRAIVTETVKSFASRLDDFRLVYLHTQLQPDAMRMTPEYFAKVRPLNNLSFAGTTDLLTKESKARGGRAGRAGVEPRLMAFLANVSALGILTMKGLVESFNDPLIYSDDQMMDALGRIFEAAAAP